MMIKNVTIICRYRRIELNKVSLDKAQRTAYNLAVAHKVNAGIVALDTDDHCVVKVVTPQGIVKDFFNGVEGKHTKLTEIDKKHGYRRTTKPE